MHPNSGTIFVLDAQEWYTRKVAYYWCFEGLPKPAARLRIRIGDIMTNALMVSLQPELNAEMPEIHTGDTVRVHQRITEGRNERIQIFQGVVIAKRGGRTPGASYTVRRTGAHGVGVERTFPYRSPLVEKVEIVRHGKVRRSKLYYLRNLSGRQARRKIKRVEKKVEAIGGELLAPEPEEALEPEEVLGEEAAAEITEEAVAEEATTKGPVAEEEVKVAEEATAEEPVAKEETEVVEELVTEAPSEEPEATAEPAAEVEEKPGAVAEPAVEEPAAEKEVEVTEEPAAEEPVAEVEEKPAVTSETEEEKPKNAKS